MISEIQQYLINIRNLYPHLPKVELTGVYDETTESAVRAFQIMKGLPATGSFDLVTLDELARENNEYIMRYQSPGSVPVSSPDFEEIKLGDRRDIVYTLKIMLNHFNRRYKNYAKLEINDLYDIKTQDAIRSFQARSMLPVTGIVDMDTWNTLVKIYDTCRLYRESAPYYYSY